MDETIELPTAHAHTAQSYALPSETLNGLTWMRSPTSKRARCDSLPERHGENDRFRPNLFRLQHGQAQDNDLSQI
jgi:hypothetical protein